MKFIQYSQPVWWILLSGVLAAMILPLVPHIRPGAAFGIAALLIGIGLLALFAFWVDWKELQERRNTYHIEPFKKRLEKHYKRRQFFADRS